MGTLTNLTSLKDMMAFHNNIEAINNNSDQRKKGK